MRRGPSLPNFSFDCIIATPSSKTMTGSRQNPCRDPARHQQGFAVARRVFSGKTGRSGTWSQTGIKQDPGRNRSRLQRKASRRPSEGGPEASGKQARIGRKPANIGSGRVPDAQESAQERPLAYAAAWDASRPMGARAERLPARTAAGGTYRGRLGAR